MAIVLGTNGNDKIIDTNDGDTIVGLDGNDQIAANGKGDTVIEGNGNDNVGLNGGTLYAGDGRDFVITNLYGAGNHIDFGFGSGDYVRGSVHQDFIFAPGDRATIDGYGGGDMITIGGHHDHVIERYFGADGPGLHQASGLSDTILGFNHSDRLVIEGLEPHPHWHQGPMGTLFVDGIAVAHVIGHHLTDHDLIFA